VLRQCVGNCLYNIVARAVAVTSLKRFKVIKIKVAKTERYFGASNWLIVMMGTLPGNGSADWRVWHCGFADGDFFKQIQDRSYGLHIPCHW